MSTANVPGTSGIIQNEPLLWEKGKKGRRGMCVSASDVPVAVFPAELQGPGVDFPDLSEVDVVRHYTRLSQWNYGVDTGMYPLGSCTMKYNPKINEKVASTPQLAAAHPMLADHLVQGNLQVMYELQESLAAITGLPGVTVQPAAGAHGELTGMLIFAAYHKSRNSKRNKILIPDTAHGTNPASAALCGYKPVPIKSGPNGILDIQSIAAVMDEETAGIMVTNPNTLGLFETNIREIAEIVHAKGGLFYCDGANTNAYMGITRPGDLGFDVIQLNLHKSFSTPHGGGGPGSGPVGVKQILTDFLPVPRIELNDGVYSFVGDKPDSIGKMKAFYGNFGVMVKAFTYIRSLGAKGLKRAAENAVLNANYVMARLSPHFDVAYQRVCMHECVLTSEKQVRENGINTKDIAKRMIDYGIHPPTIYFPMIVHEAMMFEPTETESKETLDEFCDVMIEIAGEAKTNPQIIHDAPLTTPVNRLDEVKAAREPRVVYQK